MANDISIIVSADLGDTLIKLDLAKHAVNDLGDASLENAAKQDTATASTSLFSDAIGMLGQNANIAVPFLGSFSAPIAALPAIAFAAMVAVVALADTIGTLVAITADLVAPLSLVAGLLGSLGIGFLLGAQRAAKGGGALTEFSNKLATLHSMFSKTTDILAHAFLPYLLRLADGAEKALLFIDKLAREPLAKAFHDMSTQGVTMLNSFIQQIAHVLAHPIRLAFKIAFGAGPGGNEIASAVAGWWHQFTGYLFGYTEHHQAHLGRWLGPMTTSQVDGIFQPLIDWFNRHHFTKQGTQIGHAILNGMTSSGAAQRMGQFLVQVLEDAVITVGKLWLKAFIWQFTELAHLVTKAAQFIITELGHAWDWVGKHIGVVKSAVEVLIGIVAGPLVGAFSSVLGVIGGIVGGINSAIGAAKSLVGALGGAGGGTTGRNPVGGGVGFNPGHPTGKIVVAHYHAAAGQNDLQSRAAYRQFVRQVGAELGFQQGRLAVGH